MHAQDFFQFIVFCLGLIGGAIAIGRTYDGSSEQAFIMSCLITLLSAILLAVKILPIHLIW